MAGPFFVSPASTARGEELVFQDSLGWRLLIVPELVFDAPLGWQ
jgi:hypothetical protein